MLCTTAIFDAIKNDLWAIMGSIDYLEGPSLAIIYQISIVETPSNKSFDVIYRVLSITGRRLSRHANNDIILRLVKDICWCVCVAFIIAQNLNSAVDPKACAHVRCSQVDA